ncbi:hypothetical protein, partial [Lonsdalea populi]|uniref:hypothetical protein n=1 Tax=Lonsdalea populi TaxID=1172565 RepID=UPI001C6593A8
QGVGAVGLDQFGLGDLLFPPAVVGLAREASGPAGTPRQGSRQRRVSIRPVERQSVLPLSATRYRGRAPVDRVGERQPSGPTLTDAVVRSWRARCARACSSHRW